MQNTKCPSIGNSGSFPSMKQFFQKCLKDLLLVVMVHKLLAMMMLKHNFHIFLPRLGWKISLKKEQSIYKKNSFFQLVSVLMYEWI